MSNCDDLGADIQAGLGYVLYGDEADGSQTRDQVLCLITDETHTLVSLQGCTVADLVCIDCEKTARTTQFALDEDGLRAWHATIQ